MADDRPSWSILVWLGLVAGAALGAVIVMLLRDRKGQLGGGSPVQIWNVGHGSAQLPAQLPGMPAPQSPAISMETRMRSFHLDPSSSTRLFYAAGDNPWTIAVSIAGPPGAVAFISTDISALGAGSVPSQNVYPISSGGNQTFRLQPGQDLYAIANFNNTVASIIASEDSLPPNLRQLGFS